MPGNSGLADTLSLSQVSVSLKRSAALTCLHEGCLCRHLTHLIADWSAQHADSMPSSVSACTGQQAADTQCRMISPVCIYISAVTACQASLLSGDGFDQLMRNRGQLIVSLAEHLEKPSVAPSPDSFLAITIAVLHSINVAPIYRLEVRCHSCVSSSLVHSCTVTTSKLNHPRHSCVCVRLRGCVNDSASDTL